MKPHPAADLFPMLDEDALWSLVNDIKLHGLLHPIIVWNDQIVDGRNRAKACDLAGIRPRYKEMPFGSERDAVAYIISTNIHRRHLTESQRAMIAAAIARLGHGGDRRSDQAANLPLENETGKSAGLTQADAAEQMQVSERLVRDAKMVQRDAPDLAEKVKSGELKVSKAASLARERVRVQPQTDPDRAADSVIDRKEDAEASGYTPKMEKVWAAFSALDAVEQTAFMERLKGVAA